ncbi:type VI secretion system tip protein VgrG [Variovorax sp. dw_954]|uniref:type VI secretion system Vgr family protein n=1 Tax=Variovorax sp. dw_954 TaxID=2720078 RepID=UPI001BD2E324|nr:type VI secretion system tip protein VgrG [Variovorax sp. dw_954]
MNVAELRQLFAGQGLSQSDRALRLKLGRSNALGDVLLLQRIDIREAICEGIDALLTCLSTRADLPLKTFIGQPVEVQFVTDTGGLRSICAIVTGAKLGQSDGALTVYELTATDTVQIMRGRRNSRIFRGKSDMEITETVLIEWRQRSTALAWAFEYDIKLIDLARYPQREFVHQCNESDAAFLNRLWKRSGIAWFFRPAESSKGTPVHELVLFDDAYRLDAYPGGIVQFHRDDATERRDAITGLVFERELSPASVSRGSWDYKTVQMTGAAESTGVDQGEGGDAFSRLLQDGQIEMPHAADNAADHMRRTRLRADRHALESKTLHGESGVRDLPVGQYIHIQGHPTIDAHPAHERQYVIVEIRHLGENNLPKELDARINLLTGTREHTLDEDRRYRNQFKAVRRDTPIVPAWNPGEDLPPVYPVTAIVVAPPGEEVWCDEQGRFKIQFQGYNPEDHAHSSGAGTSGTDRDSGWVRAGFAMAGANFGEFYPLREGMEVIVNFLGGDPDRPVIVGLVYNGRNPPPTFSNAGRLPGNRYISGVKTKEIHGSGFSQTRYDDSPGQVSVQVGTTHANTQLNAGFLTHPRTDGRATPRGEGAELRSDESVAIRSAKALLISAWKQLNANDKQLARAEYLGLMQDCLDLFKALGQYASEHEGMAIDDKPQAELKDSVKNWEAGSNTDENGADGGAPVVAITAPGGISVATSKSIVSYAGINADAVAQKHMQYTAGQRFNVNAGQGIGLFAHSGGIKAIANQGKFLLQSQHDDFEVNAAKNIKWTATDGNIVGMAKKFTFITEGGSFIEISDDIVLGTKGGIIFKSASVNSTGPATKSTDLPQFEKGTPDQKFRLHYEGADGDKPSPAANRRYEIRMADGSVKAGTSDGGGLTELLKSEAMQIAAIQIFHD